MLISQLVTRVACFQTKFINLSSLVILQRENCNFRGILRYSKMFLFIWITEEKTHRWGRSCKQTRQIYLINYLMKKNSTRLE